MHKSAFNECTESKLRVPRVRNCRQSWTRTFFIPIKDIFHTTGPVWSHETEARRQTPSPFPLNTKQTRKQNPKSAKVEANDKRVSQIPQLLLCCCFPRKAKRLRFAARVARWSKHCIVCTETKAKLLAQRLVWESWDCFENVCEWACPIQRTPQAYHINKRPTTGCKFSEETTCLTARVGKTSLVICHWTHHPPHPHMRTMIQMWMGPHTHTHTLTHTRVSSLTLSCLAAIWWWQ
jgi:hypothetical protein